jgi:hypothetical protein
MTRQVLAIASLLVFSLSLCPASRSTSPSAPSAKDDVLKIVHQIQKADYEGDQATLQRLYTALAPFTSDKELSSRVLYWRAFAQWRRAMNGFNDNVDPKELEQDLNQAVSDFKASAAADPAFLDAKIGQCSALGYLWYMNRGYEDRTKELLAQSGALMKELNAADPKHPRFLWIMGPIYFTIPPERGGGQDKALATYQTGLDEIRKRNAAPPADSLDPTWGEPELLMNMAWSNLNREKPDLAAAEQQAQAALKMVPNWHYVRDILIPQIQKAKSAAAATPATPPKS